MTVHLINKEITVLIVTNKLLEMPNFHETVNLMDIVLKNWKIEFPLN